MSIASCPICWRVSARARQVLKFTPLLISAPLLLTGCDDFNAAAVNFDQQDVIALGDVHTLELRGRVLSSLPANPPIIDGAQADLGRLLFWDPILSGDRDVACATCHLPERGYTDELPRAIGVGGLGRGSERVAGHTGKVPRNAQSILNTAWNGINELGVFDPTTAPMFWDRRTNSLASQAQEPIKSREEMRGDSITLENIQDEIEARLMDIPDYRTRFNDAFGTDSITLERIGIALASFQSTLVANNSPYDRWMRGEPDAMSQREVSGMQEFVIAGCADCHSGPLFSDFETHVLGVQEGVDVTEPDEGDGDFAFRTPSLRQLRFTAPYFHAGQFSTLGQVMDFYDEPRRTANPSVPSSALDPELLEVPEMEDGRGSIIQSFLDSLNDESFDQKVPVSVPSGLNPGGNL